MAPAPTATTSRITTRDINNNQISMSYPTTIQTNEQVHSVWFTVYERGEIQENGSVLGTDGRPVSSDKIYKSDTRISIENGAIGNVAKTAGQAAGLAIGIKKSLTSAGGAVAGVAAILSAKIADARGVDVKGAIENVDEALGDLANKVASFAGKPRAVYRTDQIIRLHVPQSPQEQYGAGWSEVDFGLLGRYANQTNASLLTDVQNIGNLQGEERERLVRYVTDIAGIANAAGFNFKLSDMVDLQTGKTPNPYKEQLFKSMNFRTFPFQYKFVPKDNHELTQAFKIINTFRRHMHPEKSDFFMKYPSEFSIQYFFRDQENKWLAKIANCALVDMKLDYGSGGTYTTIQEKKGAPSEITMTLQFKELELIDRTWFDDYGEDGAIPRTTPTIPAGTGAGQGEDGTATDEQTTDNITSNQETAAAAAALLNPTPEQEAVANARLLALQAEERDRLVAERNALINDDDTIDDENNSAFNAYTDLIDTANSEIDRLSD